MSNRKSAHSGDAKPLNLKPGKRIAPMTDLGDVVTELKRVYRETRRGELDSSEATRLVMILRELRVCFETRDVEARLKSLEASI